LELPDAPLQATGPVAEVREALEALGYQSAEIRNVLRDLSPDASVEESLRAALQQLGKQR
jgi:Holliday junction resolvasome RuvABC DNA-binding subunit